jgi:hypothetical protein
MWEGSPDKHREPACFRETSPDLDTAGVSIRSRKAATMAVRGARSSENEISVSVDVGHFAELLSPIFDIVLNDGDAVNPQILDSK